MRNPDELAINSQDQMLRVGHIPGGTEPGGCEAHMTSGALSPSTTGRDTSPASSPSAGGIVPGAEFRVHTLSVAARSLTNPTDREQPLYQLLMQVADAIDSAGVQVATARVELNAPVGSLDHIKAKAQTAGARSEETREDF